MIRLGKMTPRKRRWDGCHFPHTCLFMLNSPWVTARPWQNKIRVPLCTSVSLSHGIGWQVSRGEEHDTLYSMQLYFSPSYLLFYALSRFHFASIDLSLRFFQHPFHTLLITRFVSALSLPLLVSFSRSYLCSISLPVSPYPPSSPSPPLPSPPLASLPRGTKVKNTGRI